MKKYVVPMVMAKIIIEKTISVQDVDYLAPLDGIDISTLKMESVSPSEYAFISKNMSIGAIELILNVIPFLQY